MSTEYYSGQGRLSIARWKNGKVGAFRFLGNVPKLEISTKVDKLEHQESHTGQRLKDKVIIKGKSISYSYDIEEITNENLAMAYQGLVSISEAGTAVTETSPETLTKGDLWALKHQNVSDVAIVDSTGTPQPLAEGVDFSVNKKFGSIEILTDLASLKLPLSVTYNHGTSTTIEFMQDAAGEYALRFEGLNTAEDNAPVLIQIYKTQQDPAGKFDVINDDFASMTIEGEALAVDGKLASITKV